MSIRTFYDTFCDFPDCLAWAENSTSSESRNDARNKAEVAGWTYKRGEDGQYYDLCLHHKDNDPCEEEISS